MSNSKQKKQNHSLWESILLHLGEIMICGIFGILGTVFLGVSLVSFVSTFSEQMSMAETTATIIGFVDDGGSQYPYVSYEANGKQYETRLLYTDSFLKIGDEIPIRYRPDSPHIPRSTGVLAYLFGIVFAIVGLPFAIIAVLLGIFFSKLSKDQQQLAYSDEEDTETDE